MRKCECVQQYSAVYLPPFLELLSLRLFAHYDNTFHSGCNIQNHQSVDESFHPHWNTTAHQKPHTQSTMRHDSGLSMRFLEVIM